MEKEAWNELIFVRDIPYTQNTKVTKRDDLLNTIIVDAFAVNRRLMAWTQKEQTDDCKSKEIAWIECVSLCSRL